ncbi:MAG: pyrroline-5-carboxylate reductase [Candidatus Omnitrophota bacterium]|nr:pyrroline-5-carboxylate reductase [Candidatus Omnitrophota bacterium]
MKDFTVCIIGCGNMGGAIARGMVSRNIAPRDSIFLYDKDIEKMNTLAEETGCRRGDQARMVREADILVMAVKPQDFAEIFGKISDDIKGQTIVSVMAGVSISAIIDRLDRENPVARAMPNLAASVGESVTCVSYNNLVSMKDEIEAIFAGIGKVIEVEERFMDAVTAISGSGPAYLFYLAGAMIEAGEESGMDKNAARDLVIQTLFGSAAFLKHSGDSPEKLIEKVASKGGTTEAALSVFDDKRLKDTLKAAIEKAKQRSEELSRG